MTDSSATLGLLHNIITESDNIVEFVSVTQPVYAFNRSLLSTNSPVHFYIEDDVGNKTGRTSTSTIVEEIPGSSFFELAGSDYVLVPEGVAYEVRIMGEGSGGVTFMVQELVGENQSATLRIEVATTSPQTLITLNQADGVFSTASVDEDGDGKIEYEVNENSEVIKPEIVGYQNLYAAISDLETKQKYKRILNRVAQLAEHFSNKSDKYGKRIEKHLLSSLQRTLKHLKKKKIITKTERQTLNDIIKTLKTYD